MYLQAAFWQPKPSDPPATEAVKPTSFPKILSANGLFSEAEIKQIAEAMNSEKIKNLVKDESAKLVAEGGAFGFVRFLLFSNLRLFASPDIPCAMAQSPLSGWDKHKQIILTLSTRAALDHCLAR